MKAQGNLWIRRACGRLALLTLMVVLSNSIALAQTAGAAAADPQPAPAAAAPTLDTGDTGWVLLSAALVMLMTPGLAFFYGGLVRRKNILSILMQCFILLCLISVQWMLVGYSLAFGPDVGGKGLIGNLEWMGLKGVLANAACAVYAPTVPHQAFMIFQMMFAVITPALIIGAFAERIKFSSFCVFTLLWSTLVYDPVAHWVWGNGGFIGLLGGWRALDFAGGTVVHVNAGVAALAAALFLGKRRGYPHSISPPHNLPFAVLGAALLWLGWFGFNAGSALSANGVAVSAFVATHLAAAMAGLTWAAMDWFFHKKPTTLGAITGAVAGLVSITPAAGFVDPLGALLIGIGAAVFPWLAVTFVKNKLGYDDSLDAFGVHGIGGIWGALATGLFAQAAVNPAVGRNGLFYGCPEQFWIQIKAVAVAAIFSFAMSCLLFWAVDKVMGLRVAEHDERVGLDLTQHREAAYTVID